MKRFLQSLLLLIFIQVVSSPSFCQDNFYCQQASDIIKTVKKYHYKDQDLNPEFSEKLFYEFIETIDPDAFILTNEDLEQLKNHKNELDKEILYKKCDFIPFAAQVLEKRFKHLHQLINDLNSQKINFSENDSLLYLDQKHRLSEKQLDQNWESLIKLKVLYSYFNSDTTTLNRDIDYEQLNKLKEQVITRESCKFQALLNYKNGVQAYVGERFLTALSATFDPHTHYFTAEEAKEFQDILSKETAAFGLSFEKNRVGEIEVNHLVPGGPAWNSNLINEGDIIMEVKYGEELKSFTCLHYSEIKKFIHSEDINTLKFHIKKKNGKQEWVELTKQVIDVEGNIIKSFLLNGDIKAGYIYLPSFYTEQESIVYPPKGCANDFATELIRLKREGIDGLILDLRNNGGGSMLEAIQMAGIFINYGAICLVDSKEGEITTLKDMNRGHIYRDPLIILTNQLSASASELFAAAMQDQNRAVIVGTSTYGKSTVQTVLPTDAYKYSEEQLYAPKESVAYLKITTSKFYRVTGKTHQREGVQPDITLPSLCDNIEVGEKHYKNALPPTQVEKKVYYYPSSALPIQELKSKSGARVKNNPEFIEIMQTSKDYAKMMNMKRISVSLIGFKTYYTQLKKEKTSVANSNTESIYQVANPSYIKGTSSVYNSENEVNYDSMSDIKKDPTIRESFLILNDLIQLSKY